MAVTTAATTAATAEVIAQARAGDADAFRRLTEPHRRELLVHCYRMLGSLQDAEDALQDTLVAAWRGLGGFEKRSSVRTWLYRIATNRCLDARRAAGRRPAKEWDVPSVDAPEPSRLGEVAWLEPFPDSRLPDSRLPDSRFLDSRSLDGAVDMPPGPDARYDQAESISLAFVTALQALPPRQVAVVVLRDVLGFHALEVAAMLDTTVDSVTSALKRGRAGLQRRLGASRTADHEPPPTAGSEAENALATRFARAWETADVEALVALLTDDAFIAMPPIAFEYQGRDVIAGFCAGLFEAGRRFDLVPTRANGQPAFGAYLRPSSDADADAQPGSGTRDGVGLYVLTLAGGGISAMIRFEKSVLPAFGLPPSLPPAADR